MPPQCEWCGEPTKNGSATCSTAHRVARWRWLNGVTRAGGAPPEPPPWPASPLHGRMGENDRSNAPGEPVNTEALAALARERDEARAAAERERASAERAQAAARRARGELAAVTAPGPRAGAKARSGLILSYSKAVKVAQDTLAGYVATGGGCSEASANQIIEFALRGALSEKMRAKLETRDAA